MDVRCLSRRFEVYRCDEPHRVPPDSHEQNTGQLMIRHLIRHWLDRGKVFVFQSITLQSAEADQPDSTCKRQNPVPEIYDFQEVLLL